MRLATLALVGAAAAYSPLHTGCRVHCGLLHRATPVATPRVTSLLSAETATSSAHKLAIRYGDTSGATLRLQGVELSAGDTPLLVGADWEVMSGERWGIVGGNGCGKSTLLRAIVGQQTLDAGDVTVRTQTSVGYLEQTAVSGSTRTVFEEAASQMDRLQAATKALDAAGAIVEASAEPTGQELDLLAEAQAEWEAAGGADADGRVARVLDGLGFTSADQGRPCSEFSGGWQMRIALARLLLSEPELLLLDEPTNHLDLAARDWLGAYLASYRGTAVLVSHDLALLKTVTCVAEVSQRALQTYRGGWEAYEAGRGQRAQLQASTYEAQQKKAAELERFIERFGATASKASQANSRKKELQKLQKQMVPPPSAPPAPPVLRMTPPPRSAAELVALSDATIGYGADGAAEPPPPLLEHVNMKLTRGMRLLLLGPNGAGKSTLLAAISARLPLLAGERLAADGLDEGEGLALFRQDLAQELQMGNSALEEVLRLAPDSTEQRARDALGALNLRGDAALRSVGLLSGGEKARVALAAFALQPLQLLLADEPSNHLDMATIGTLQRSLKPTEWEGALVLSSHDKAFCDGLELTHVAHVCDGTVRLFDRPPNAADWATVHGSGVERGGSETAEAEAEAQSAAKAARAEERRLQKEIANAPKRIERIEKEIEDLESVIEQIDEEMMGVGSDATRAMELSEKKEVAQGKVDGMYKEWERLEEMLS